MRGGRVNMYLAIGFMFGIGAALGRLDARGPYKQFGALIGIIIDTILWPVSVGFYLSHDHHKGKPPTSPKGDTTGESG